MKKIILDVVTSKKGSSGKTLISLFKFDLGIRNGYNVMSVDTNDMNPDMYLILQRVFKTFYKIIYQPSISGKNINMLRRHFSITVPEEKKEEIDLGSMQGLNYQFAIPLEKYTKKSILGFVEINRYEPKKRMEDSKVAHRYIVRFSTLDMIWALSDVTDYIPRNSYIDYIIIDTNTSDTPYKYLLRGAKNQEGSDNTYELSIRYFPFASSIAINTRQIDKCFDNYIKQLTTVLSGADEEFKARKIMPIFVLTFIPPLYAFLQIHKENSALEKELEVLRELSEDLKNNFVPHIIANMYSYVGMDALNLIIRNEKEITSYGSNMAEAIRKLNLNKTKTPSGYILDIDSIISIFKSIPEEEIKSNIVDKLSDIKEPEKNSFEVLAKLVVLEKCLFILKKKYRYPIINLSVMPIFDIELSHLVEILRSEAFEELLKEIALSDSNSEFLYRCIANYGIITGLLPILGIRIKSTDIIDEMVATKGVLAQFLESINRFVRGVKKYEGRS